MSAYLLVSLQSPVFAALGSTQASPPPALPLQAHPAWNAETGWKHLLNNLRLLLQPLVCASLLLPWLQLVPLATPARRSPRPVRPHEHRPPGIPQVTEEGDINFAWVPVVF